MAIAAVTAIVVMAAAAVAAITVMAIATYVVHTLPPTYSHSPSLNAA